MNFLAIQTTYQQLQIGLFENQKLIDNACADKKFSSKEIIPVLDALLEKNDCPLKTLSFIAVNQGPAPFTALRVVLATANGIHFAAGVPLVGIDGLAAFIDEYESPDWPATIALLNAFNKDTYFAISSPGIQVKTGYQNCQILLEQLKKEFSGRPIRFIGDGVTLLVDDIIAMFGSQAYTPEPLPQYTSIEQIGAVGLAQWQQHKNVCTQLLPLYLKALTYKKSIAP